MKTNASKTQQSEAKAAAKNVSEKQNINSTAQLVDNRFELIAQKALLDKISNSPEVLQQKELNRIANSNSPAQLRAKVDAFNVDWDEDLLDNYGVAVGFSINIGASFSTENGNQSAHAEYHQFVSDSVKVWEAGHDHNAVAPDEDDSVAREDDGYNRAADPDDYDDDTGTFTSDDKPGMDQGTLSDNDYIEYSFTLDSEIVDTDRGVQLAHTDAATGTIVGTYKDGLNFTRPANPAVHYTAENADDVAEAEVEVEADIANE